MEPKLEGTGRLLPYRIWEGEVVLRTAGWIGAIRGVAIVIGSLLAAAAAGRRGHFMIAGVGGVVYLTSGIALHLRARWGWFGCLACSLGWCAFLAWLGFATHEDTITVVGLPDLWEGGLVYLLATPLLFPEMIVLVSLVSPWCRQALWHGDLSSELASFRTTGGKRLSVRVLAAWAALVVAHVTTAAALFLTPGFFSV